jgi:hypothetical protein
MFEWPLAVVQAASVKSVSQMTSLVASLVAVAVCLLAVLVWLSRRRKRVHLAEPQSHLHASPAHRNPSQRGSTAIEIQRSPMRIAPSQSATVEQPAIEEEAAKIPEERNSEAVPPVAAPQSEILEAGLSGNPAEGASALDEVQDSGAVIAPNEGRDCLLVPIEVVREDVEPQAAAKAHAVEPDDANPKGKDPSPQILADAIVLEPKSTAPGAGDISERTRDEATLKTEEDDLQQDITQRPEEVDRALPRYRPPVQKTPRPVREKARAANEGEESTSASSATQLGIRVHLTFDRGGMCSIGLLPERMTGLDNEVPVKLGGKPFLLLGQDDWYEDLYPEDVGALLRNGLELKVVLGGERRVRWLLSGRDLYVLASSKLARGFVSTNRLALGRLHVVLCAAELLENVEALLNEAGCQDYAKLGAEEGIPAGWVGLRDVKPTKALPLEPGNDAFYPIKAAPDIEIDLDGGICLGGSVWLAGYPPEIRVLGESAVSVKPLIDGEEALPSGEGLLTSDGYDRPGVHSVYCEGLSCSRLYTIEDAPTSWERWPAYRFSRADLCGPVVDMTAVEGNSRAVLVPMSNPVLLGAHPGQIFHCSRRGVSHWKGFVPFDVVWALPSQPLRSDKKSARILQLRDIPAVGAKLQTGAALEWSVAILDSSRKGLRIENSSPESMARWMQYKETARSIWRSAR